MASGQKKVIVRTFSGAVAWGYLPQTDILNQENITLMAPDGRHNSIQYNEIKMIAYVRDFNLDDSSDPERIGRRAFPSRPRGDGLWLHVTFTDDDQIEGLTGISLGFLDTLIANRGFFFTPPDARSNTARLFIPRHAIRAFEVLGYVTAPSKRLSRPTASGSDAQPNLFPPPFPALPDE